MPEDNIDHIDFDKLNQNSISKPLIKKIYTRRLIHFKNDSLRKCSYLQDS